MTVSLDDALQGKGVEKPAEDAKAEPKEPAQDAGGAPEVEVEAKPKEETKDKATAEPEVDPEDAKQLTRDPRTGQFTGQIPYAAYKGEKSKRKELEKEKSAWAEREKQLLKDAEEAKTLREKIAAMEALQRHQPRQPQPQQQRPRMVDPVQDPDGFNRTLYQTLDQRIAEVEWNAIVRTSKADAIREHGREAVEAAGKALEQAAATNPGLRSQFMTDDPVGAVVRWHKRQQTLERIGDDPDAFIQSEVERRIAEMRAAPAETPKRPAPNIPTDLSAAPNVGSRAGPQWSGPTALEDAIRK